MPIALGLLLLLGVGLALSKSTPKVDTTGMPAALIAEVNAAVESAEPSVMRATAAKVRKAGFPVAATSLEAAALDVEKAIQGTKPTRAGVNPAPKADDPDARALAGRLAGLLSGMSSAEAQASDAVKNLTLAFQSQEKRRGFYVGNLDGLYGPKTALALVQDHGIVPPAPLRWPKKSVPQSQAAYRSALATYVAADPQRAEEWTQAMNLNRP
jgi:hypothetical protein